MKYFLFFISCLCFQVLLSQNDSIINFGENLVQENKLDEAINYYNKHLLKPKTKEQEIFLLLGLAEVYKLKLNYNQANNFFINAFEKIKNLEDKQLEFLYHVKLGEFFRKRSLETEFETELDKARKILKSYKINDKYLVKYYNRKAALFTERYQNNDSTLFYANKSLDLAKKVKDKDNEFYSLLEIAGVYERKKDYKTSIRYIEEIIEFAKNNNMQQQEADAYISYIMALARSNQLEKALNTALHAANFSKKNNLLYNEIIFNENIQNLYFRLKNTEKAYEYLKYRLELTTKYNEIKKEELLFNLEAKYKLADKENQIKINTLELDNKNKALASNKIKLYVSIGLLLAATLVTILIAYFFKKEKHSNKKLQALSYENEFLLSEANHRINNNLQLVIILIADQLKKIEGTNGFELKNILTKVEAISTLHKHLYKNTDKKKINAQNYLEDVKVSFFDVFKANHITINFNCEPVGIPNDIAMYFGLLLTELFINSIKHAFLKEDYKEINFELYQEQDILVLKYSDNGKANTGKIVQPKLINKLCRQLKAEYKINTTEGFVFVLEKHLKND